MAKTRKDMGILQTEKLVPSRDPVARLPMLSDRFWMLLFAFLILAVVAALISYGGYLERKSFLKSQRAVAYAAIAGARHQIDALQLGQRTALRLFARAHQVELQQLLVGEYIESVGIAALAKSLKNEMPHLQALTLVEVTSNVLLSSAPDILGVQCHTQIHEYLNGQMEPSSFLHGMSKGRHYDVISEIAPGAKSVLVASFSEDLVINIMQSVQPPGHSLFLLKKLDQPAARQVLGLQDMSPFATDAPVIEGFVAEAQVNGSNWWLTDAPKPAFMEANQTDIVKKRLMLMGLALLAIAVIYIFFMRRERALFRYRKALLDANEKLKYTSLHDKLTNLPNRVFFEEQVQAKIMDAQRSGRRFLLMLISLNEFDRINLNLGYEVGNEALSRLAKRLVNALREVDSVARFEGDVFAVLAGIGEQSEAGLIASKVVACLDRPIDIDGSSVTVGASIGAALFPDQGREKEILLKHADSAVKLAKSTGEHAVVFSVEGETNGLDRLSLVTGITQAMQDGSLTMVYQPKLTLMEPEKQSFEALLRWNHSRYGPLSSEIFIPLVEQTPHIVELTHWTVESCFSMISQLATVDTKPVVAINLSARILEEDGFSLWVERMFRQYGISSDSIRFELTESAMMHDSDLAMQSMLRLAALGVGLSVDDFGVGHSSLAYISRLPVDELKVDKSFITNMLKWDSDRAIVKATIGLAHDLGLSVVAEGVETLEQATLLREMECDVLQGYYISRPLTERQLISWLAAQK